MCVRAYVYIHERENVCVKEGRGLYIYGDYMCLFVCEFMCLKERERKDGCITLCACVCVCTLLVQVT